MMSCSITELWPLLGMWIGSWLFIKVIEHFVRDKQSVLTLEEKIMLREIQKTQIESRDHKIKTYESLERIATIQYEILRELERVRKK